MSLVGHPIYKSKERNRKISESHKGMKSWNKGKKILKLSGKNHWNWKGGKSQADRNKKAPRVKSEQCEICGSIGRICFDHNHKTGKFRGWICWRCNIVLGLMKDNTELLRAMMEYLIKNNL